MSGAQLVAVARHNGQRRCHNSFSVLCSCMPMLMSWCASCATGKLKAQSAASDDRWTVCDPQLAMASCRSPPLINNKMKSDTMSSHLHVLCPVFHRHIT